MKDPAFLSARKQAELVADRDISCVELLDHTIRRVERLDPKLNAVVVRDFERARERAKKLDRSHKNPGPLHGVPMTVKESHDVVGLPTTWGDPARTGNIAAANSVAVDRLLEAGAVVFGKSNVPLNLGDWQSFNEVYGTTNNPWDLARVPGGSSGGGAAAVSAGLSALECGSDIGGSIRQPAHACGLFGHKPTWGVIPLRGHAPVQGVASTTDISVLGPLARSADDLSVAFNALAGPDTAETEMRFHLPPPRARKLRDLRIAVWPADPATSTDSEMTTLLHELAVSLKGEGAKVSVTARPEFDAHDAFVVFLQALAGALSGRGSEADRAATAVRAAKLAKGDVSANAILTRAAGASHADWLGTNERRCRIRRAWGSFFQDWDVMLCPVHAVPAQLHMQEKPSRDLLASIDGKKVPWGETMFWPGIVGGFHLPASVAPLGLTRAGLPVGVQIVGPLYGDRTTLAVAKLLEKHWRGFVPPPGWE